MHDDLHFIEELKNGSASAFEKLVRTYSSIVYNTSVGIVQHAEDAEDVSQEVFTEVFQSVKNFRGESKLSTWVYRIAVQKSLDHLRRSKRHKRSGILQSLFKDDAITEADLVHSFQHPGVQLENKERSAVLFAAIAKLPENQKTAFVLHKVEGLSYQEITEVMNTSLSSVESLMFRAKQKLQHLLKNYYEKN